jgi:hypothetical protein
MGKEVAAVEEGGRRAGAGAPIRARRQGNAPASVVVEGRSGLACLSFG